MEKYLVVKEKYIQTKTYIFFADGGFPPPPLTDMSAKNVFFLDGSPKVLLADVIRSFRLAPNIKGVGVNKKEHYI